MKKVLVKKAISAQYPVGAGAPVMVLGGGGGGGGAMSVVEPKEKSLEEYLEDL